MAPSIPRRLRVLAPLRRPARQRVPLLVVALALVFTSPSLQVGVSVPNPVAAPRLPLAVPPEAVRGVAEGAPSTGGPAISAQPAAFQPVSVRQFRIQVEGVAANALDEARTVEGVAFATAVSIGGVVVGTPASGPTAVRVAAVNPGEFRVFTSQAAADTVGLWEYLAAGQVAFTHEQARKLGVQLGQPVTMGEGMQIRVGAFATNTTPPVADAVVDTATGQGLGLAQEPQTLLVAVHEGTSAETVARDLEQRLDARASVIPDPRAPRPVLRGDRFTSDNVWDLLALCESGGDWHANTGNGYYGGLQFLPESWYLVGGTGLPHEASREEQIFRARLLYAIQGWKAWPACSLALGLRTERTVSSGASATSSGSAGGPKPSGGSGTRGASPTQEPTTSESESTSRDKRGSKLLPPLKLP